MRYKRLNRERGTYAGASAGREALFHALQVGRRSVPVVVEIGQLDLDRLLLLPQAPGEPGLLVGLGRGHRRLELLASCVEGKARRVDAVDPIAERAQLPTAPDVLRRHQPALRQPAP